MLASSEQTLQLIRTGLVAGLKYHDTLFVLCEPVPMPAALNRFTALFDQARRALLLVWGTSRGLFLGLVLATLIAGVLPALAAWIGQRIVDAVVSAMQLHACLLYTSPSPRD